MTREENRAFMKDFFERYYKKRKNQGKDSILITGVKIAPEMQSDEKSKWGEEYSIWKLIPSTVSENDLKQFEETYHLKLPECIKAFLSVYHHRFGDPIGYNDIRNPFWSMKTNYTHQLAQNGYLSFAWDSESIFIRCIDLSNMPDEETCPIVEIDHELFFNLQYDAEETGILIPREQLTALMHPVADNFYQYLNGVFNDKIS